MAAEQPRNGQSHVYYKFSSSKDFDFVRFDGEFITVGELKYLISKKTGVWKDRTTVIELFEPRTQEEYKQNNRMIRKNASVIAKRSPAVRAPPIALQGVEGSGNPSGGVGSAAAAAAASVGKAVEGREEKVKEEDVSEGGEKSKAEKVNKGGEGGGEKGEEEDPFGPDAFAPAPEEDEDSTFKQLAKGLHQSWQDEMNARGGSWGGRQGGRGSGAGGGRGRGGGGRGRGGRGLGIPPYGYVCHRCNIPGHYIEDCPTNGDPAYDFKRVRYPTGIPSSMLEKDDQGGLLMPNGERARLKPNRKKFEQEMAGVPKPDRYQNLNVSGGGEVEGKELVVRKGSGEVGTEDKGEEGEGGKPSKEEDTGGGGGGELAIVEAGGTQQSPWKSLVSLPSFVDPFGVMFPMVKKNLPEATLGQLKKAFFEGHPLPEDDFHKFRDDHRSEVTIKDVSNRREESVGTVERGRSPPPASYKEREPPFQVRSRSPVAMYRSQVPPPRMVQPSEYRYSGDYGPVRPPPPGPYCGPWPGEGRGWHPGPYHEPDWFGYGDGPFPNEPYRPPGAYMNHGPYPPYPEVFNREYFPPRMSGFGPRDDHRREYWSEMDDPRFMRGEYRRGPMRPDMYPRHDGLRLPPPRTFPPRGPRIEEPLSVSGDREFDMRYSQPIPRSPEEVHSVRLRRHSSDAMNRMRQNSPDVVIMGHEEGRRNIRRGDPMLLDDRMNMIERRGKERGDRNGPRLASYTEPSSEKSAEEKIGKGARVFKPAVSSGRQESSGAHPQVEGPPHRSRSGDYQERIEREERFQWSPRPDVPEFVKRNAALRHSNETVREQQSRPPQTSPARHHREGVFTHRDDQGGWENLESDRERHGGRVFFEECKRKQRDLREMLQDNPKFNGRRSTTIGRNDRECEDNYDTINYEDRVEYKRRSEEVMRVSSPRKLKRPRLADGAGNDPSYIRRAVTPGSNFDEGHWHRENAGLDGVRESPSIDERFQHEIPAGVEHHERTRKVCIYVLLCMSEFTIVELLSVAHVGFAVMLLYTQFMVY